MWTSNVQIVSCLQDQVFVSNNLRREEKEILSKNIFFPSKVKFSSTIFNNVFIHRFHVFAILAVVTKNPVSSKLELKLIDWIHVFAILAVVSVNSVSFKLKLKFIVSGTFVLKKKGFSLRKKYCHFKRNFIHHRSQGFHSFDQFQYCHYKQRNQGLRNH